MVMCCGRDLSGVNEPPVTTFWYRVTPEDRATFIPARAEIPGFICGEMSLEATFVRLCDECAARTGYKW